MLTIRSLPSYTEQSSVLSVELSISFLFVCSFPISLGISISVSSRDQIFSFVDYVWLVFSKKKHKTLIESLKKDQFFSLCTIIKKLYIFQKKKYTNIVIYIIKIIWSKIIYKSVQYYVFKKSNALFFHNLISLSNDNSRDSWCICCSLYTSARFTN